MAQWGDEQRATVSAPGRPWPAASTTSALSRLARDRRGRPVAAAHHRQDPARERAAPRRRAALPTRTTSPPSPPGTARAPAEDRERPFVPVAGAAPGLHRRARGRRPRRHALGHGARRRRPRRGSTRWCPSTSSSTTPCRSTRSATRSAYGRNIEREYERNRERYTLLRWAQQALQRLPGGAARGWASCTRSTSSTSPASSRFVTWMAGRWRSPTRWWAPTRTPPWSTASACSAGASAASRPRRACSASRSSCSPRWWSGCASTTRCRSGTTATDLVLTLTEMLRKHGVVNKFVEFCGAGLTSMTAADRATLSNMAPEYGATASLFPVDARTLEYLRQTGREEEHVELVERYCPRAGDVPHRRERDAGVQRDARARPRLDGAVGGGPAPSPGPRRAARRVEVVHRRVRRRRRRTTPQRNGDLDRLVDEGGNPAGRHRQPQARAAAERQRPQPPRRSRDGSVVIAAITSCTNTSNPSVMLAAGLLAQHAVERGLTVADHVKTSLAPGSRVVTDYLRRAGVSGGARHAALQHRRLRLHHLHRQQRPAARGGLEPHRVRGPRRGGGAQRQPQLRGSHPPAGEGGLPRLPAAGGRVRARRHGQHRPHHASRSGAAATAPTCSSATSGRAPRRSPTPPTRGLQQSMFHDEYARIFDGDEHWQKLPAPDRGDVRVGGRTSTYVREPPFFADAAEEPRATRGHRERARPRGARRLDHHRPHLAGGQHLAELPGRRRTCASTASSCATSTPTARGAATTR